MKCNEHFPPTKLLGNPTYIFSQASWANVNLEPHRRKPNSSPKDSDFWNDNDEQLQEFLTSQGQGSPNSPSFLPSAQGSPENMLSHAEDPTLSPSYFDEEFERFDKEVQESEFVY